MLSYLKQTWLLILLSVGFGVALGAVQSALQPRIDHNQAMRIERAVLEVVPGGAASAPMTIEGLQVFRVTAADGSLRGWGVPATGTGFQDRIDLMIGLSADGGAITGLQVLFSNETPGLGDKIYGDGFRGEFVGKPATATLKVIKAGESDPHPIHAITGATISSKAVTNTVNAQLSRVQKLVAQAAAAGTMPENQP